MLDMESKWLALSKPTSDRELAKAIKSWSGNLNIKGSTVEKLSLT
jgi:hypothetical protein